MVRKTKKVFLETSVNQWKKDYQISNEFVFNLSEKYTLYDLFYKPSLKIDMIGNLRLAHVKQIRLLLK